MKVLANDGISQSGVKILQDAGYEVLVVKVAQNQLINYINKENIEVLLVRSATQVKEELIDACPNLKLIGRGGVGMDNIAVQYAQSKGIKVINTADLSSNSVAELVFAHLFSGVRFLHQANREMPLQGDTHFVQLKNAYQNGRELKGKILGIIGLGRIGKEVAKMAISLGMKVIAYDPNVKEITATIEFFDGQKLDFNIKTIGKEELLKQSDFITLHLPFQQGYIIDKSDFLIMKNNVGIINASRGGLINEQALFESLNDGKVSFAGLDVFENEPNPSMKILMHPNVSLTPHIGAATQELQEQIGIELGQKVIKILG